VRAVLGQQVSVAAARTLATRLVARFGEALPEPREGLTHLFPTAERIAKANVEEIGLPRARAEAIRGLARAVLGPDSPLVPAASLEEGIARLEALPGFGPFTANYIAMRALREPDAFPAGDLALRKAVGKGSLASPRDVEKRAEPWRPFRAYAALHLWTAPSKEKR
jgi:3-methyladenine DNA glycosylase/8-oxoguanine DNA glycosylase